MNWVSTRGASPPVPFIDALFAGTAPDGKLPHTNGWVFWRFRDDQGRLQPIDKLRTATEQ